MHRKLQIFLSVALGAALLMAPSLGNIGSDSIYDLAFAAKGGNGKGNGGQNGNGNGKSANSSNAGGSSNSAGGSSKSSGGNKSASLSTTSVAKSKKEKSLTSQMGALNAAHASAQAFANPNPNSRVGRVKAAVMATAATVAAQTAYDAAVQTAIAADPAVVTAQANVDLLQGQVDAAPDDAALGLQLEEAKATLADAQKTAATTALADPAVVAAQGTLDAATEAEGGAWDAAANKAITDDVKQATIDLVGDKVDTSAVTAPTPTPAP